MSKAIKIDFNTLIDIYDKRLAEKEKQIILLQAEILHLKSTKEGDANDN